MSTNLGCARAVLAEAPTAGGAGALVPPPAPARRAAVTATSDAWQAFQSAGAEADQLDASGATAESVERRSAAVLLALRELPPPEVATHADDIEQACLRVVQLRSGPGLGLYSRFLAQAPAAASEARLANLLHTWSTSHVTDFGADWSVVQATLDGRGPSPEHSLLSALRTLPPRRVSRAFARGGSQHFFNALDRTLNLRAEGKAARLLAVEPLTFELLDALTAGRRRLTRGEQLCALGDAAARRGAVLEARARYRAASERGCDVGSDRLADSLAREGAEQFESGDLARAEDCFLRAQQWRRRDPEYEVLSLVTRLFRRRGLDADDLARLPELATEGADPAVVSFWTAIAHLLGGRPDLAADAVQADAPVGAADGVWGAKHERGVLRAALAGDHEGLLQRARAFAPHADDGWADGGPADPAPMLIAAIQHDPELALRLLGGVPPGIDLPVDLKVAGATIALSQSISGFAHARSADAVTALGVAERLLGARPEKGPS